MYSLALISFLKVFLKNKKHYLSFDQNLQVDVFLCLLVNSCFKRASLDNARLDA